MNPEGPFTVVIYETDYHDDLVCNFRFSKERKRYYDIGLLASSGGNECG